MCSGFMAGEAYTLRYYFTSTSYNNGARVESFTVNFVADYNGKFAHTLHLYDDGTLPRGVYVCTAEVDNYSSPSIVRTFMATNEGGVKNLSLLLLLSIPVVIPPLLKVLFTQKRLS